MRERPNILLIMTDQQRGDCLGIEGHPDLFTPNLDDWANLGVRFTQAYTPCPVCSPARRSVLTGRHPASEGVLFNVQLPIESETLPDRFRSNGYQTFSIGRNMHQFPNYRRYGFEIIEQNPFEEVYSTAHRDVGAILRNGPKPPGSHESTRSIHFPHLMEHGITTDGYTCRAWPHDEQYHETVYAVNKAIERVDRRDRTDPFFMYLGFTAPHPPLVPPAFYFDRYRHRSLCPPVHGDWVSRIISDEVFPGPHSGRRHPSDAFTNETMAAYYALINHIDDQLYRLMERLNKEKEPTYVLFTSDHGEMLGDHGLFRKVRPYDGSVRVPFFMFSIGTDDLNLGKEVATPVILEDIFPTLTELTGLDAPDGMDGRSLVPLISGNGRNDWGREIVHSEAPKALEHEGWHMLTDGKVKYIWFSGDGTELLFDLTDDPRECRDLSMESDYAGSLKSFRQTLIGRLEKRPEGFSDGTRLIAGRPHLAQVDPS